MHAERVVGRWSVIMCSGAAALLLLGCGALVEDPGVPEGELAGEPGDPAGDPAESSIASPLAGCTTHAAGAGFGHHTLAPASTMAMVDLEATANGDPLLDAVISMSRGNATSFNHLATSVRFSTAGVLDVRDGATYRADTPIWFWPGDPRRMRILADVPSHTFSVYVDDGGFETARLAKRYAFRPTTATVPSLDRLVGITDGPSGSLTLCQGSYAAPARVAYTREGSFGVVPLASDTALVSDGAVTMRLSATGTVLNQVAVGGELAADASGNAYVASASGGALSLAAYTPALGLRWSRFDLVPSGSQVVAAAADAGGVTLALRASGVMHILRYPFGGGAGAYLHVGGTHAALAADGFAVATATPSTFAVTMFEPGGRPQWTRSFPGAVGSYIEAMSLGLNGRVAIGGDFSAPITFGGPTLELIYHGQANLNTFLLGLDRADGGHVFTNRVMATLLSGMAGNGTTLVLAGERIVGPIFPELHYVDANGGAVAGLPDRYDSGFHEEWGLGGRVAIGASNRVYWERQMKWPWPHSTGYPYLVVMN